MDVNDDRFIKHMAAVFELVSHNLEEVGISDNPQPDFGLSDHGIIRLGLEDLACLVARVVKDGETRYDPEVVRRQNIKHRARRAREAR